MLINRLYFYRYTTRKNNFETRTKMSFRFYSDELHVAGNRSMRPGLHPRQEEKIVTPKEIIDEQRHRLGGWLVGKQQAAS